MTRYTPQWLQAGSYAASVDRRLLGALWPAPASSGCQVTAGSGMAVNVFLGQVAVPTQNNTGTTLCSSDALETVTLAAAPASPSNRIDLIICQPRGGDLDAGSNNDFIFTSVLGNVAASPVAPAAPAGSVALAQVYIPGSSAAVSAGNITDLRPGNLAIPVGQPASAPRGYLASITGPASQTDCGSTPTTLASITFNAVAGRWYRFTATVVATQITAVGNNPMVRIFDPSAGWWSAAWSTSLVVNAGLFGTGSDVWQATATGPTTTYIAGLTSAGALRVNANACRFYVEDIGSS